MNIASSGERGIRTPGSVTFNGFQDRRNRPLCQLSVAKIRLQMSSSKICLYLLNKQKGSLQWQCSLQWAISNSTIKQFDNFNNYHDSPGITIIICFLPPLKIPSDVFFPITSSLRYLCRLSTVATGFPSSSTIISPTFN